MRSVTVLAPAKVNLHLGIYPGRDERGYHRADSVMVALGLADRVTVSETPDSPLHVSMDVNAGVGERDNTAYVAAERLCAAFGRSPEYQVSIEKRVPPQSGLGGSSSDGAATILALCDLWGVSPASDAVVGVARSVGADVPFFLNLAPSLLEGAGDVLRRVFPPWATCPSSLSGQRAASRRRGRTPSSTATPSIPWTPRGSSMPCPEAAWRTSRGACTTTSPVPLAAPRGRSPRSRGGSPCRMASGPAWCPDPGAASLASAPAMRTPGASPPLLTTSRGFGLAPRVSSPAGMRSRTRT